MSMGIGKVELRKRTENPLHRFVFNPFPQPFRLVGRQVEEPEDDVLVG